MADERDYSVDALSEKDIYEEARDRLKIAEEADSDNRKRMIADLQFCEGDQWDHEVMTTVSQETPELTINLTKMMVQRVVNNMKQQRPRGKCHPVSDGASIEVADTINGIGRHVEYRSEASVAYDTGAESAVKCGVGYWRITPEYVASDSMDVDLRIYPIRNIFSVYMDPAALMPTGQDADWVIISRRIKRTEYKRLYRRAANVQWTDTGNKDDHAWENKEEIRLAEYFRLISRKEKLHQYETSDGKRFTIWESEVPSSAKLKAAGVRKVSERDSSKRQLQWFRLNGTKVVDREDLPGEWIPVIRCEGNAVNIDGKIIRSGMVAGMKDAARMVNYGEVAKIRRLGLTPQAPWVVAEGQIEGHPEWTDSNQSAHVALVYKPVTVQTAQGEVVLPPPQRQMPAQLEAGFSEFVQGMRSNLMALGGMPNEPGQDPVSGEVVSGKALQRRQWLSDQSHFQYFDNQTLAIAHTWRIMVPWIQHYMSEERMQRILGEDMVPKMVRINESVHEDGVSRVKHDLDVGRYDVVMDTGPGYETKREEGAQTLIDLVKIPAFAEEIAKHGMDLVFRSIDHPYMQELADRIVALTPKGLEDVMEQLPERARSIVRAMATQIQQLQQALQQAQMEKKYDLQGKLLTARTKVHDTHVRAQTARDVAEINKGADLMKEAMIHHHDERMAIHEAEQLERQGTANGRSSPE